MSPPAKKRRTDEDGSAEPSPEPTQEETQPSEQATDEAKPAEETKVPAASSSKPSDRMARFKALQARANASAKTNLDEARLERNRLAADPSQLKSLQRKRDIASHKLLKSEIEDAGEDFERKRAWDWTVDESEKWDKRVKKKDAARDNNAFSDPTQESNKIYKRQLRNIDPNLDQYEKDKMALIEKAAASGGMDLVETERGEIIAVDKNGDWYSTANSTSFAGNKPDKAAVDRLVKDLQRADEARLKKRKDRMEKSGDDGDITYINEKNKQFNQKLARFYDKYTEEIRDSFERGTRI